MWIVRIINKNKFLWLLVTALALIGLSYFNYIYSKNTFSLRLFMFLYVGGYFLGFVNLFFYKIIFRINRDENSYQAIMIINFLTLLFVISFFYRIIFGFSNILDYGTLVYAFPGLIFLNAIMFSESIKN